MSVMGFQKKFGWRVGGWGELYPIFFGFLEKKINFAKPLSSNEEWLCVLLYWRKGRHS